MELTELRLSLRSFGEIWGIRNAFEMGILLKLFDYYITQVPHSKLVTTIFTVCFTNFEHL